MIELARQQARVTLGTWIDPRINTAAAPVAAKVLLHDFAIEWFEKEQLRLGRRGEADLKWRLESHLLPFFANLYIHEIDEDVVFAYRDAKLRERNALAERIEAGERPVDERGQPLKPLSNTSINMTLTTLRKILKLAVRRKLLAHNPAADDELRLKAGRPRRTWLMPDQALDLIDAAERIDGTHNPTTCELAAQVQLLMRANAYTLTKAASAVGRSKATTSRLAKIDLDSPTPSVRRAIVATMILAGPRAAEVCELRWRDVDLVNRRLTIRGTKTAAGDREVRIVDFLARELERWARDASTTGPGELLFPTATGRQRDHNNIRKRVIAPAVTEANRVRRQRKLPTLPQGLTPHSCRRSFAALMLADNRPVPMVQYEIGHADARTTLNIYAQVVNIDFEPTREMLHALCGYEPPAAARSVRRPLQS